MIITDGINRYEVRLSADLKNNASVRFELKKYRDIRYEMSWNL